MKNEELTQKLAEEKKQIHKLKKEALKAISTLSQLETTGNSEKVRALNFIESFAKFARLLR